MEDGVRLRGGNLCQRRVGSNDIVKFLVIDVERLGQQRLFSNARPDEQLELVRSYCRLIRGVDMTYRGVVRYRGRRDIFQNVEDFLVNDLGSCRYSLRQGTTDSRADSEECTCGWHLDTKKQTIPT